MANTFSRSFSLNNITIHLEINSILLIIFRNWKVKKSVYLLIQHNSNFDILKRQESSRFGLYEFHHVREFRYLKKIFNDQLLYIYFCLFYVLSLFKATCICSKEYSKDRCEHEQIQPSYRCLFLDESFN